LIKRKKVNLKFNVKKVKKRSPEYGRRQDECERAIAIAFPPNTLFYALIHLLRADYWCRQLALSFASHEVPQDRLLVLFEKLEAHALRVEMYVESPIAPPRLLLVGSDAPELSLLLLLPTDGADMRALHLAPLYALLRLIRARPWRQRCQVHPSTLLLFDLSPTYDLLPQQRAFACEMIAIALLRGLTLLGRVPAWSLPAADRALARADRLLPKLLEN
jgi:hypothetical protein